MSTLTIPNSNFVNGGLIQAADHNANNAAIATWANGNIDNTNMGTLLGTVNWNVSTNVTALAVINSGTASVKTITQNGILAASNATIFVTDSAAQTTGVAGFYYNMTSASSTMPVIKTANTGTGKSVFSVQTGIMASGQAVHYISDTAAETTATAIRYAEATNASTSIPMDVLKNAGSGDMVQYQNGSGVVQFSIGSNGAINRSPNMPGGNKLLNSDGRLNQRGTQTITNGNSGYFADRWYIKNSLGGSGTIAGSVGTVTTPLTGTLNSYAQVAIGGTGMTTNGCEVYQVLENRDSLLFYNQTASFAVQVQGIGNVNQVGIQFFYATTEAKLATSIGTEVTATVSSGGWTNIVINGQALGTAQGTSGVIGVRIRITGVSSGHTYDAGNGFAFTQAQLNLGLVAGNWEPAYKSNAEEIQACLRYYEKSYDLATAPATASSVGANESIAAAASWLQTIYFKALKRVSAASYTTTIYSSNTGTSAKVYDVTGATDVSAATALGGQSCILVTATTTDGHGIQFQWAVDADI